MLVFIIDVLQLTVEFSINQSINQSTNQSISQNGHKMAQAYSA